MLKLSYIKEAALDLIFPKLCLGCNKVTSYLCADCISKIEKIKAPICPICGKPQIDDVTCFDCIRGDLPFKLVRSVYKYKGIIRKAIIEFKYNNLRAIANQLGVLMSECYLSNSFNCGVIVPVPLHRERIKRRGYNQSLLLASNIGDILRLPISDDSLVRIKDTKPQVESSGYLERKANVFNSFKCQNSSLCGRSILLVDDVYTSGATLEACALALKKGGCAEVSGLTLAREIEGG